MKLIQIIAIIQRTIINHIIDRLLDTDDLTEWHKIHSQDSQEVNEFVALLLSQFSNQMTRSVEDTILLAESLANEHYLREFKTELNHDTERKIDETIEYLNVFVIRGLLTDSRAYGTVEHSYKAIVKDVAEQVIKDDIELEEAIKAQVMLKFDKGLLSGYFDNIGRQWRLDRYVMEVLNMCFQKTYRESEEQLNVELVKIFQFPNPRHECTELQESGIICIVPKSQASLKALQYPNIYDHAYLEPHGHRGINCRHIWHSLEAENNYSDILYSEVDLARKEIIVYRDSLYRMMNSKF